MHLGRSTAVARTANSVTSASSQEDSGNVSDDEPDLGRPEYWNELVVEVAKESQPSRASTLQGVHDDVLKALDQPHVETWVKRIYRQAAFDATAASDSSSDFNRKEQEFAEHTSQALQLLRMQGQGRASAYGGAIGNLIFQKLATSVVVPTLSTLIARFADDTESFSDADARECLEVFLPAFLDEAGRNRMSIAIMTGSDDVAEFGVRAPFGASMTDRVGEEPAWSRWNSLVAGKIHQITAQSGRADHVHGSELWPRGGHPWANVPENQLRVSMSGGECVILNLQEGRGQYDDMTDLSARFTFRWEAPQQEGGPIIIHDLACHHVPYDDVIEQRLADDILGVIRWDKTTNTVDELRDRLAGTLHTLSHSTTFIRGQAAITEWVLQALARLHGYEVTYSAEWTAKSGVQPDQQALSILNRQRCGEASAGNLLLSPLIAV